MSKREEVMMQREAFRLGADFRYREMRATGNDNYGRSCIEEAEKRYPLTETRPRVVIIGAYRYRAVDGELEYQYIKTDAPENWYSLVNTGKKAEALALADLLAHPTEEVPL